jgi:hypothetical protein
LREPARLLYLYPERSRSIERSVVIMEDITVESISGTKTGTVWEVLNQNGPSTISDIAKSYRTEPRGFNEPEEQIHDPVWVSGPYFKLFSGYVRASFDQNTQRK